MSHDCFWYFAARAERATAASNTAIEDAHKDAISKAQVSLLYSKMCRTNT
jgi:hypothetical protein